MVELHRSDTHEDITDDLFAWNDTAALFATTPEALTCLLAKALCLIGDGFVRASPVAWSRSRLLTMR